ncbi:MAG: GGDEF domain-containing protein [Methylobacter tundripaludum]|nr:GGDEF domain-containing protein [Methylobacter tundripaludum]
MTKEPFFRLNQEPDALNGFSRTVAEIEWLLLVLMMFYLVVGHLEEEVKVFLLGGLCAFASFVMVFHYFNFFAKANVWKLAIETWVMILLITWFVWHTGRQNSLLLNLYFLPIITSSLALGKLTTLLEVILIGTCYVYLGKSGVTGNGLFSLSEGSVLLTWLFPMLLVGYITTMLSNDIYHAFSRVKTSAQTDELTSLYNRGAFMELLEKQLHQARRGGRTFSLLLGDCNNLKIVNDRYGHEAGNLLLRSVADNFRHCLRGCDSAARYGGDEFTVLLPETTAEEAELVAKRIKETLVATNFNYRGNAVSTDISVGIATYPQHGDTADLLLRHADEAMYANKRESKNRVAEVSWEQT